MVEAQVRHTIANKLKLYTDQQNISQRELSRRSGIPVGTISGYFKESSTPNEERVDILANALHVKPEELDPIRRGNDIPQAVAVNIEDELVSQELDMTIFQLNTDRKQFLLHVAKDQLMMQKMEKRGVNR